MKQMPLKSLNTTAVKLTIKRVWKELERFGHESSYDLGKSLLALAPWMNGKEEKLAVLHQLPCRTS